MSVCPDAFQVPGEAQTGRLTVEEYVYIPNSATLTLLLFPLFNPTLTRTVQNFSGLEMSQLYCISLLRVTYKTRCGRPLLWSRDLNFPDCQTQ